MHGKDQYCSSEYCSSKLSIQLHKDMKLFTYNDNSVHNHKIGFAWATNCIIQ